MPDFVSLATSIAELVHGEKLCTQSITQSPRLFDTPGTEACTVSVATWAHFLSHSTCWALLADNMQRPGFKSRLGHEFSVGWTNDRYAMRLVSRTGTEGPAVSSRN